MKEQYIKLSDLRKVSGIGGKTIDRIKETLLQNKEDNYISKYNPDIHLDTNNIYNGDCLKLMNGIPDKSVDMILCDLPYGTTACKWDTVIPFEPLWKQYSRIIKDNGIIVLTSSQPFTTSLINSNIDLFKYDLIWQKSRPSNFPLARRRPLKYHEDVCVFYKSQPTYNPQMVLGEANHRTRLTRGVNNIIGDNGEGEKWTNTSNLKFPKSVMTFKSTDSTRNFHPTQKPVDLFEYLIKTYTNEGDTVIDNCIGSGTTAIACLNTGRNYIGIELEKEYFDIAVERVKSHKLNNK